MIKIYGIKNCDAIKKTLKWFADNAIDREFIDWKKTDVDNTLLNRAMDQHGWEAVINKRGTTWRTITDEAKANMTRDDAEILAHQKPAIIKRPLIDTGTDIILGFDSDKYDSIFVK
jgi:arsenate reductase